MHLSPASPVRQFIIPNGLLQPSVSEQNSRSLDRQYRGTHLDSLPHSAVVRQAPTTELGRSKSVVRTAGAKWTSGPGADKGARSSSWPSAVRRSSRESQTENPPGIRTPTTLSSDAFPSPRYQFQSTERDRQSEPAEGERSVILAIIETPAGNTGGLSRTSRALSNRSTRSSIYDIYEKAKLRGVQIQRKWWSELLFEYTVYALLLSFIYFVLVGLPLWRGAVWWLFFAVQNKMVLAGSFAIIIGVAMLYAFAPLLVLFEPDPLPPLSHTLEQSARDTALIIPCYKAASIIGPTLGAAINIFPPQNIFVIANGNSPQPLDNTEEVCKQYRVNHIWSPVGSKIVAQFIGCYAAKQFKNALLIDDDCALPPNFPIVSDRLRGKVKCIGYALKSIGSKSAKPTYCQRAQDLEYKISGLQRALAGKIGSATFPHGAISLWDRKFLVQTFHDHEGFSVSEDWFMGHSCRRLGGRIQMCTSVFVETETPSAVFYSSGGTRGGFGEMTVFKQRFHRWNFFFVNGLWYNLVYIFSSWKLGFWDIATKFFVFQEVYETLLYLTTPFVLPISMLVRPGFCGILLAVTILLYLANVVIFNEVHLRRKNERVGYSVLILYYMPYKLALTAVNVASCYWSLFKYAKYFARRHPKVVEDERAVEVVLGLHLKGPRVHQPSAGQLSGYYDEGRQANLHDGMLPVEPQPAVCNAVRMASTAEDMV